MNENFKEILLIVVLIAIAILFYPWIIEEEDGKKSCKNLLGIPAICRY